MADFPKGFVSIPMTLVPKDRPRGRVVTPRGKRPFVQMYTPAKTVKAEQFIAERFWIESGLKDPFEGPVTVQLVFHMPIPSSWSKKRQKEAVGQPHTSRPDLDNLVKTVLDALNGFLYRDDSQICELVVRKEYQTTEGVVVGYHAS